MAQKTLVKKDFDLVELQSSVEVEKKKREVIRGYVQSQLLEGIDYGTIPIGGRESKPCLFKPGMEKILSLMLIQSSLEKDTDTWEMAGSKPGLICYRCTLTRNNQVLAEGRGAATVGEKNRDINATIKIAEKRARMDATLSLGFSEFFTQDLDDMPIPGRSEQPKAQIEQTLPDGYPTIQVTDERHGEKDGKEWQRVKTNAGAAWNNSGLHLEVGQSYIVQVQSGAITGVEGASDDRKEFSDFEDYMPEEE